VRQDCREWDRAGSKGIGHRRVATRRVPAVWTFGSELDPSQVVAALRDLDRFRGGLEKVGAPCRVKRIARPEAFSKVAARTAITHDARAVPLRHVKPHFPAITCPMHFTTRIIAVGSEQIARFWCSVKATPYPVWNSVSKKRGSRLVVSKVVPSVNTDTASWLWRLS